ncbi:hypothetical protein BpHYR1_023005 [Brachionus plicatilis]|uniref:Uncharacterized protein n=1 Tax=Brachionus plicatilis TaxID=10195 RepID=A0A3M7QEM9_BRAPC|nr:hypothetical protein BpHYR1_023005 [Brachionus plicatilis]
MIRLIILLISVRLIKSSQASRIELQHIEINEELEPNYLIINFTELILHRMRLMQKNPNLIRLESLELEQTSNLNEYFSIDLKKFRLQDENGLNKSSIILLRTSSKKLDREYLCRTDIPSCPCAHHCFLNLNLSAHFENFGHGMTQIKLSLPILLNDLNDNKPFFYQPEIIIDLNQMEIGEQDLVTIPLKLAVDLDSTELNQVVGYALEKVSYIKDNYASISFSNNQLDLLIDLRQLSPDLEFLSDKFKLIATDSRHHADQLIQIKYKIPKLKPSKSTKGGLPSPRVTSHQTNVISIISAINDIEIVVSNSSESYELKFKSNSKNQIFVSNKTDSLITLAYFIVEKTKAGKKLDHIELRSEQAAESGLPLGQHGDLFVISEMRNGLYSISVKSEQYHQIIKFKNEEKKINYSLLLRTKIDQEEIFKAISMQMPASLFVRSAFTSSQQPRVDSALESDKLDLQNYLVIVSIACVVLAVFAVLCLTISVMCFCCKKCQDNKKDEKIESVDQEEKSPNIMVYDVLPNQTKSLSSSSSSSCTSSNLSPVTTTTTSMANEQMHEQKPINPLFDTNLGAEWFQAQHQNQSTAVSSPLSASSSSNLIKTVDEVDKYKNDLYRNAQVMYKQKQLFQQNQSNYYSFGVDSNVATASPSTKTEIYQAKPVSLLNNSMGSSSPSYSFINEVNLNSVDNLKDSIKEKMMSRLNEALTNPNLSSKSFGQISCV